MMINPEYAKPILELANLCTKKDIPFTLNVIWDGLQIRFPWHPGDMACHAGTYGHTDGCVESYQFPWDNGDVSVLEPEVAVELLFDLYNE